MAIFPTIRIFVELAIPCEKPGPRVFEGFTVGFHPRSWEIVRSLAFTADECNRREHLWKFHFFHKIVGLQWIDSTRL